MDIDPLDHYTNIGNRLIDLHRKLDARRNNPAHKLNCEQIEAEIARLEDVQRLHAPAGPVPDIPQEGEQ
jgi:hypothetical protein